MIVSNRAISAEHPGTEDSLFSSLLVFKLDGMQSATVHTEQSCTLVSPPWRIFRAGIRPLGGQGGGQVSAPFASTAGVQRGGCQVDCQISTLVAARRAFAKFPRIPSEGARDLRMSEPAPALRMWLRERVQ